MRKQLLLLAAVLISFSSIGQDAPAPVEAPAGYKPRSGVAVGDAIWMDKNLDVEWFRNGDRIQEMKTAEEWMKACKTGTPAWCYYEFDEKHGKKYGKIYNWAAVSDPRGLAPYDWHVPSVEEFDVLAREFSSERDSGTKLWSKKGFRGFVCVPAGYLRDDGELTFSNGEKAAYWWTSTKFSEFGGAWGFDMEKDDFGLLSKGMYANDGLAVRCVKD